MSLKEVNHYKSFDYEGIGITEEEWLHFKYNYLIKESIKIGFMGHTINWILRYQDNCRESAAKFKRIADETGFDTASW